MAGISLVATSLELRRFVAWPGAAASSTVTCTAEFAFSIKTKIFVPVGQDSSMAGVDDSCGDGSGGAGR
ncbi:MAG TPA: hypothetical protein VH684_01125 [Xanthobacteraceae bacterium]